MNESSSAALDRTPVRSDWRELLGSMRFAIALLTIICVASVIGTVLKQGEPLVNYVDAFGPFWAEVFSALGLFRIYSAGWFLLILAFLVLSTSLCIARNAPKFWADFQTFKEHIRASALRAFHHKASGDTPCPTPEAQAKVMQTLTQLGWQIKVQARQAHEGGEAQAGTMVAARKGRANKLGYIAAHLSIVLICVGGLLDGDLMSSIQAKWMGLKPYEGGESVEPHSLSVRNPAFRAQLFVPEGQRSSAAVVNLDLGSLLQPLPFDVELKKFVVEYYDTGMPRRFASDIVIHDHADQSSKAVTIEVNKPYAYNGYNIFQSSFEDGGSQVDLTPLPLDVPAAQAAHIASLTAQPIKLAVGNGGVVLPSALTPGKELRLELTGLRPINVENRGALASEDPALANQPWTRHLGSGDRGDTNKHLVNVGPQISYKLRDAAGQASEFQNYMLPIEMDGVHVFLLGVRESAAEPFRYLRIPADEEMQIKGWMRLKHALSDAALRQQAAAMLARARAPQDQAALQEQLQASAQRVLDLFAGQGVRKPDAVPQTPPLAGFDALTAFIDEVVPAAEQTRMSETLLRLLNASLFELNNLARQRDGLKPLLPEDPATVAFMTPAVVALSDVSHYPAPVIFIPHTFEQRQASVFQVTRAPGQVVVYAGCALLIAGVFAMLYIRERRVWVWLEDAPSGAKWTMALSSTRQTMDTDHEFEQLQQQLSAALTAAGNA
jgi:cytochrome c biogenesis protein